MTRSTSDPSSPQPPSGGNTPEYSVSELSGAIKRALEDGFGYVRLKGEISGYRGPHASGHCYFALKEDKAKIEAVIWKGVFGRLRFKPEEGMEVIAQGRITTFPGSSKYQIVVEALEPAGAGALMALLEERKRRFTAEGLFDDARKKPLPFLPRVIGIVTSPTGAVIRDMLHGFNERFPAHVLVWGVRVQGEGSAGEVAAAIRGFNAIGTDGAVPRPDVLIVARGGGSLEDLWSFNEDVVVRAAAESRIPLISAVGHETDWTLLDLVADARAPTPTKAAEWAVPKYSDLVEAIEKFSLRQRIAMRRVVQSARTHLKAAERGLPRAQDLTALPRQRFDGAAGRLDQGLKGLVQNRKTALAKASGRLPRPMSLIRLPRQQFDAADRRLGRALLANTSAHGTRLARLSGRLTVRPLAVRIERNRERLDVATARGLAALSNRVAHRRRALDANEKLLASLSYQSVLSRGYVLVRDADGRAVRHASQVQPGHRLGLEFIDGTVVADAVTSTPGKGAAAKSPADAPPEAHGDTANTGRTGTPRRPASGNRGGGSQGNPPAGQGSLF
ncbi:MAG: exodeoxyribonuclease VII large subunit [Hyphomicrobium sp.]